MYISCIETHPLKACSPILSIPLGIRTGPSRELQFLKAPLPISRIEPGSLSKDDSLLQDSKDSSPMCVNPEPPEKKPFKPLQF